MAQSSLRARIDEILADQTGSLRRTMLACLINLQEVLGYLPPEAMEAVAQFTGNSINDVYGVATFYPNFRFEPPGEHVVEVCWGPSCHLKGAKALLETVQEELQLQEPGTTGDGKVSLRLTSCAACCSQAAAMVVDHHIYGNLSPQRARALLASLKREP